MHRWWVFLHIAGAFGFLMAHGVSAYVTLRLPKERDPARVSQLLELSASSVGFMWNSIGLLLIGGIAAGFTGQFWGQGWIWAAIVILVVVMAAMYAMGTTWAKRLRTISSAMVGGTEAVSRPQFEEILRSKRPYTIAAIGFVGLLAILWLMIFKPTLGFGGVPECPAGTDTITVCAPSALRRSSRTTSNCRRASPWNWRSTIETAVCSTTSRSIGTSPLRSRCSSAI